MYAADGIKDNDGEYGKGKKDFEEGYAWAARNLWW